MMMNGEVAIALIDLVVGLPREAMIRADLLAHMGDRELAPTMAMVVVMAKAEAHTKENGQVLIMVKDLAQFVVERKGILSMAVVMTQVLERKGTLITAMDTAPVPVERGQVLKMAIRWASGSEIVLIIGAIQVLILEERKGRG